VPVRIDQTFPRCARCGRMIHDEAPRIEIGRGRRATVLCSELCRDEYVALHGLADRGTWRTPAPAPARAAGR
jgi:hypothetical protein